MKTIRFSLLASAALFAAPALAQQAVDIVVTAQRANQTEVVRGGQVGVLGDKPAEDVPFAIKSYSATLILNQQPQTLGQVLENDPSIRLSYGFGNAAELFIIRGFPLISDDIAFGGLYGLLPRQLVAPELYDQVQVLNGASAFLNGAAPGGSGLGGTVNLTPKRAEAPLTRFTGSYIGDSHFGGSFDVARRFGQDGAFGVRVNGAARAGDVSVDDEYRSAYVLGGGFDWRGDRARLSLDLAYQKVKVRGLKPKVFVDGVTAIPEPPEASSNFAQPWTFTELRDVFGMVRGEYDIAEDVLVYASFGARDGSEDGIYSGITLTNPVTGDGTGDGIFVPRTDNNETGQIGLRAKVATGSVSHEINAGASKLWQVNRNAFDFFAGFATNLYDAPVVPVPPSIFPGGDINDPFPISRTRLTSFYLSDTIGAWDDRVLLTLGLRNQRIKAISYNYSDGSEFSRYSEDATTPVIGLVVKPAEGVSLYANRIQGLEQGEVAPVAADVVNPGEIFPPYKSTQYEIGGKVRFGGINASLAWFQTSQPVGIAVPEPTAANPAAVRFALDGEQRNRGVEFAIDGELAEGLRLIGGASVTSAKLRRTENGVNDGRDAVGVPDYTINANVEWDTPFVPGLTLTGRVVRTGEQKANIANTLEIDGWTRFDVGARYVFLVGDNPLTIRANIDNVADKDYWSSAFDSFRPALLQGLPRTFKLSASIDL